MKVARVSLRRFAQARRLDFAKIFRKASHVTEKPDGALLRRYVDRSLLSENKIAKYAGITGTQLRNYMKGTDARGLAVNIPSARFLDLARALGIPPSELRAADRPEVADALESGGIDPPKQATLQERLERLRDDIDGLLRDVRTGQLP